MAAHVSLLREGVLSRPSVRRHGAPGRFAPDSLLEGTGFEPVWGFSLSGVELGPSATWRALNQVRMHVVSDSRIPVDVGQSRQG